MVFSKASVWYENVVKPLRRLTSATTNALLVSQRQPPRAPSPTKSRPSEEFRVESSPVQECVFNGHPKQQSTQQQQQTWRDFLQNPLDVMLSDSYAPQHPVNMISQRFNKPFSTSVVDQARGKQPEKQTPRPYIERPSRRSSGTTSHLPKSSARQKEFGSKKYRKYFRDKIMRKGPNFNIRRRNKLCMQSFPEDSKSSVNFVDNWNEKLLLFQQRKNTFDKPMKAPAEESPINLSLNKGTIGANGGVDSFKDNAPLEIGKEDAVVSRNKEKEKNFTVHNCAPVKAQIRDAVNILTIGSSKASKTSSPANAPTEWLSDPCREDAPETAADRASCSACADVQRSFSRRCSIKRLTMAGMCDNVQEAAEGFKCSLWRRAVRAVSSDTLVQAPLGLGNSEPCSCANVLCCTSVKSY